MLRAGLLPQGPGKQLTAAFVQRVRLLGRLLPCTSWTSTPSSSAPRDKTRLKSCREPAARLPASGAPNRASQTVVEVQLTAKQKTRREIMIATCPGAALPLQAAPELQVDATIVEPPDAGRRRPVARHRSISQQLAQQSSLSDVSCRCAGAGSRPEASPPASPVDPHAHGGHDQYARGRPTRRSAGAAGGSELERLQLPCRGRTGSPQPGSHAQPAPGDTSTDRERRVVWRGHAPRSSCMSALCCAIGRPPASASGEFVNRGRKPLSAQLGARGDAPNGSVFAQSGAPCSSRVNRLHRWVGDGRRVGTRPRGAAGHSGRCNRPACPCSAPLDLGTQQALIRHAHTVYTSSTREGAAPCLR